MEHSLLHGLQLAGLVIGLGGAFFWILVLRRTGSTPRFEPLLTRWTARAGGLAAAASFLNILINVAELGGGTIYSGLDFTDLRAFLFDSAVGKIELAHFLALTMLGAAAASKYSFKWPFVLLLGLAAAFLSSSVSHAAALPDERGPAMTVHFVHIVAAALWLGMLAHLFAAVRLAEKSGESRELAVMLGRFSPIALGTVAVLFCSGTYLVVRFVAKPGMVLTSAYGLTLTIKLLLLGLALYPAYINWRQVRPAILGGGPVPGRFRRLLELEISAGVLVVLVAGILGSVSPPAPDGRGSITSEQAAVLLSPTAPGLHLPRPEGFVGAPTRTADDLRYSEFTHRWSGIFVILLGLAWLGLGIGRGRAHELAGWWALLLIPFGIFIAAVADPELWILRTVSVADVLANSQMLQHQLGALLVFALAALALRDRRRPAEQRPLGKALPVVILFGSLMLLGHAHSSVSATEELTTVIDVQHAIMGGFGVFAGALRWFQLRNLLPDRFAGVAWPGCILLLGIAMAFFYRELVPGIGLGFGE